MKVSNEVWFFGNGQTLIKLFEKFYFKSFDKCIMLVN